MCMYIHIYIYIYIYISIYEHKRLFMKPPLLGPPLSYAKYGVSESSKGWLFLQTGISKVLATVAVAMVCQLVEVYSKFERVVRQ